VPYDKRNEGNQRALSTLLEDDELKDQLEHNQLERLGEIDNALDTRAVQEGAEAGPRMLLTLDMGQGVAEEDEDEDAVVYPPDPLAAISVGNPDTADTTSYNIAGMNSNTDDTGDEVLRAQGLYEGQAASGQDHAVVSWIGYDPPTDDDTLSS
ncbi:alpha/beta hydrolase, partial [Desulforhabdus sp. TSK]|uniref:alpha/beta hydrolase n=1 Tax=Desulforhabdus sp. TSK TaxID=2925014 RepID=UPI001FC820BE